MPKIFEYLGITIMFYSKEHEPIHVHGKYQSFESKADFIIVDGKIIDIKIKDANRKSKRSREHINTPEVASSQLFLYTRIAW